jgi:hypothetical protein
MKGVGRIYQQTVLDTYTKVAFAKLYDRKTPITAVEALNDRVVPFYDEHGIRLPRVLTDRGTEFCGSESHEYELYLAVEDIDHTRTKAKCPQTTDEVEYPFFRAVLFSARLRMTSRRRVGLEVKAWPRCLHSRSSFEASADTRLPRLVQPWVNRLYAASARSPRWRSSRRDRARLYA